MASASARDVALDPRWLPHTYGPDGTTLTSVFVPRENHADLMFLSDEHFKDEFPKVTHRVAEIAADVAKAPSAPIHFIFHTAFCCSTLLVKALDSPKRAFGLKEPDVLINLAYRFSANGDRAERERLRLALRLLRRPFDPEESIIVKPTNFANGLIIPALEALPDSRAVLLYSDAATLLRSLAKRGMWGRIFGRKLYQVATQWGPLDFGYDASETFQLTDLQVAGLSWLMQIHHFREAANRLGRRVMLVDSADFLADPARTLEKATGLFGLDIDGAAIARIAQGPVFSRHSKFSELDYGVHEREAEHDAAVSAHGEEIEMVVKWIEAVAAHMRVPLRPAA